MPTDHSAPRTEAPCRECARVLRGQFMHTGAWGVVSDPVDVELQDLIPAGYVLDPDLGRASRRRVRRALQGFDLGQRAMDLVSTLAVAAAAVVLTVTFVNGAQWWPSEPLAFLAFLALAAAAPVLLVGERRRAGAQSMSEAWVWITSRDAQTWAEIAHLVHLDETRGPRRDTAAIERQWRRVWRLTRDQESAHHDHAAVLASA